jgi:maltose O-acetyltransferase
MGFINALLDKIRGEQDLKKLINRGLKIGKNFKRMGGCIIDPSHCWHIEIGNDVTLAPRVHILAHDTSTKNFLNHTRVAAVVIEDNVFIGAGAIILPGVTIGRNTIIGAGSIVSGKIAPDSVYAGNPARFICKLEDYLNKEKARMHDDNTFDASFTLRNKSFNQSHVAKMKESCDKYGKIYVE